MKLPPRLRLEPSTSRIGVIALLCATVATAALMFITVRDASLCALVVVGTGVVGVRAVRKLTRSPLLLFVGADLRISVTGRDGRTTDGTIHDDSSVGAWLTTIAWIPDGARWYTPARTLVVLPDTLNAEDFRRLRLYLRHGRVASDPDTSGVAAR